MKFVLQILLIFVIVATISICAIQPEMHKNMIVYDSAYTLVTEQEVKTETKDVPVMEMPAKPVETTVKAETMTKPVTVTKKTQEVKVKQQTKTTPKQTTVKTQAVSNPQTILKPVKTTTVVKPNVVRQVQKTETPKVETKVVNNPSLQPYPQRGEGVIAPKVLTQQEETIAWNIWRSNLTNKIMQDTKLPYIPNGVLFEFSFNVDKFGKITNVQTGASPVNYTPYAIQYIAPVIRNCQGRSILNFPEGTVRTSTTVTGKWRISNTEKFSTPQDYNDIEKVIK